MRMRHPALLEIADRADTHARSRGKLLLCQSRATPEPPDTCRKELGRPTAISVAHMITILRGACLPSSTVTPVLKVLQNHIYTGKSHDQSPYYGDWSYLDQVSRPTMESHLPERVPEMQKDVQ
jgi:hypothetical protein